MAEIRRLTDPILDNKGTYALLFRMKNSRSISIGKLGEFNFQQGYYIYVGSAQGPGGLSARINHHCNPSDTPHWHMDYFKKHAILEEIWINRSPDNQEHKWASIIKDEISENSLIRGFGSSDCSCVTHLFHFVYYPDRNQFMDKTGNGVESIKLKLKCEYEKS